MILVTGATGLVGGHLLGQLCRDRADVRALVRTPERADALRGIDCEMVVGDYDDPASLAQALRGVDTAFLVAPSSERLAQQEGAFLDAVAAAGGDVRVVLLAAAGIDEGRGGRFDQEHQRVVDRLRRDVARHAVLAPGVFAQNLLSHAARVQAEGVLAVPAGDAQVAHVDARDVAAVAAHVLTSDGHDGATYVITGPEALGYAEVAARLSAVAGREVRYEDVPIDVWFDGLLAAGVPRWNAEALRDLYEAARQGAGATVTDEVEKATGRPARTLDDFLADHRAAFAAVEA